MSVEQQLGLAEDSLLVAQIRECWPTWSASDDRLSQVPDFDQLKPWLKASSAAEKDDVLHALATLAAVDGGDDVIAGAALAWVLMPGINVLTREVATWISTRTDIGGVDLGRTRGIQFGDLPPAGGEPIDDLVAGQLWIEVRSFPWQRLHRVAANVLFRVREGVRTQLGDSVYLLRKDRAWALTDLIDDSSIIGIDARAGLGGSKNFPAWGRPGLADSSTLVKDELEDVLDWGVDEGLIDDDARRVLATVVEEAETAPSPARARTHNGGLTSREVTARVAPKLGVSPATVRRRVQASVAALAAASDRYVA